MSYSQFPNRLTLKHVVLALALIAFPVVLLAIDPQPVTAARTTCTPGSINIGDAPSPYAEACATVPSLNLYIGSTAPVSSTFNYPCTHALADCNSSDNFLNPLTPIDLAYSTYTWTIPIHDAIAGTSYVGGWIDFNGNHVFDASEGVTTTVVSGATAVTLTWNIPITATPGITTYARLRISTDPTMGPYDNYGIGEVEDYQITTVHSAVCDPGTTFFYISGATPNTIQTYNVSTGVSTPVYTPTTRANGLQAINGLATNPTMSTLYFQDNANSTTPKGIYYYQVFTGTSGTVTANAGLGPLNIPNVNADGWQTAAGAFGNGKYYAGVDGDDSGRVYEVTLDSTGTTGVSARLVVSPPLYPANCTGNIPPGGTNCRGYGDILVIGNRLYAALWTNSTTPESQIFDVFDINSNLLLSQQIISASGFAFQLGRDGSNNIYAVTSDNGRVFNVTNGAIQNYPTAVRTIGSVVNDAGECLATYKPTAVTLSSSTASNARNAGDILHGSQASLGQVTLAWTTASEVNTAGFNLYRSERPDGPYVRINPQLIPASSDALVGGKYQYVDTAVAPGQTYYYQLEDVELNGTSTRHPAVSAIVASAPGLGNAGGALTGLGLGALALAGAGFVILRKRSSVA